MAKDVLNNTIMSLENGKLNIQDNGWKITNMGKELNILMGTDTKETFLMDVNMDKEDLLIKMGIFMMEISMKDSQKVKAFN